MAVELRCPECQAKLRLQRAPEPDSEIECTKCGFVFSADDNPAKTSAADEEAGERENQKGKKNAAAVAEKPATAKKSDKPKANDVPFKRKKRRGKKKKTNPVLMWSIIGGALLILGFASAVLYFLMSKKTSSQEMMSYLPDECDEVIGINLGHLQKYPEFYKACEMQFASKSFRKAADVFSKALGSEASYNLLEYVIQGEGKSGGSPDGTPVEATILRTKAEFDTNLLSKMPGAQQYTAEGVKYYTINDIPDLKYPGLRVFAPTNRLVVFCRGDMPDNKFKAMITGNKANPDASVYKRCGPLFKQVTRGTVWKFDLYGRSIARPTPPPPPASGAQEDDDANLKKEIAEVLSAAQGSGFKASVGSRDVRGEWVVWFKDSDAASAMAKKWKEKDWVKDEEKDPPRWWRAVAAKSGGGKTAANALRDGLGFRSSGETFSVRTSVETKTLQTGMGSLMNAFVGQQGGGGPIGVSGPGGVSPGGPPTPGGEGGGPRKPSTPAPSPSKRRRFYSSGYKRRVSSGLVGGK
jgi:transcription initiation factor TFIIIB Brf1 subunit/transcription initiation factor TFIIB